MAAAGARRPLSEVLNHKGTLTTHGRYLGTKHEQAKAGLLARRPWYDRYLDAGR